MTDYSGFRITEIHAITGIDGDDEEGIVGFMTPRGPMPMISADKVRFEQLLRIAQELANADGRTFRITKFTVREDVGEIKSEKLSS